MGSHDDVDSLLTQVDIEELNIAVVMKAKTVRLHIDPGACIFIYVYTVKLPDRIVEIVTDEFDTIIVDYSRNYSSQLKWFD